MSSEFVHLHLHTDYSMLDGACDTKVLCKRVKELQMPAVAMTDHGNIFGAVHFFNDAKEAGIKPILGCELYVCKKEDHRAEPQGDSYNHLIVLAENETGYRNLTKICSEASLHGFYYKPRVSKRYLAEHSEGLIGLSACLKGEVAERLTEGKYEAARTAAKTLEDIFGRGNFFLEIQDQGMEEEKRIHKDLFRLEQDLNIPMVATNDSHYICEDDCLAQDVMICIQTGKSIADPNRMKFQTNQFFVKSAEEMGQVFQGYEPVLRRTLGIAERCNLQLAKIKNPFPKFEVPEGETIDSYFERIAREGMARRMNLLRELQAQGKLRHGVLRHSLGDYEERLNREIGIIKQMQFPGYFLIVWDFIRYAKESGIPVGPGRGSAAGSLVGYAMGITDIDPIQNELLFERFLNPERVSMPDIDVDFCMNRRGEVIQYVTEKYGREQVAQIITFGTLAAKAAIKDTGRVLDMPYAEVDRIAKMIPGTPGMTIDKAMAEVSAFADVYTNDAAIRNLVDTAKKLEGMVRNSGVHASAVVIAPRPLDELVPLYKTKNEEIVTAYDMTAVEKMGLLKMDFLGLTTLTIIDDCQKLIRQTRGETVEMEKIPLEDAETYEKVFHRGQTSGVFQFESDGMRDVLRRYQPATVEDLTALNALYRPGPIQGGMIDDFIERKWGRKKVDYMLPELERLLKETLGVIVYQEQVMQIANVIAGYSLGEADLLRRAMGKKIASEMDKQRARFMQGAAERKFPAAQAGHIFDLMAQFAGYGFNKSHSAAYALVAYQTAYLKTHYPVEFMAALLTSVTGKTEDVVKYIAESREMGIEVLAPDVHESAANFTPIIAPALATAPHSPKEGGYGPPVSERYKIRFGLSAVKNVGANAIGSIVEARRTGRFKGIYDFCERVDLRLLNRRVLESLIKSGAMDSLGDSLGDGAGNAALPAAGAQAGNAALPAAGAQAGNAALPAAGAQAGNAALPAAGAQAGNAALPAAGAQAGNAALPAAGARRAQLMEAVEKAMEQAQKTARDREAGQHGLFGIFEETTSAAAAAERLPNVPDWDESVRLANEKEILGFWISGHPLEKYAEKIEDLHAIKTSDVLAMKRSTAKNEDIAVAGLITGVRVAKTRKGDLMAGLVIEDMHGRVDAAVFPEAYRRLTAQVKLEVPVLVKAAVRVEEDAAPKLFINEITPLEEARVKLPRSLRITIRLEEALPETVDALHGLFTRSPGSAKVLFDLVRPGEYVVVMEAEGYNVSADRVFLKSVGQLCGPDSIKVID